MVKLTKEGDVHILTMDAGENRINRETLDELGAALDEVEGSSGAGALVTTGTGKFYSNGFDIPFLMSQGSKLQEFVAETVEFFARVLTFPMPTVAALNGHTFAAGAMFACAHDVRIMREDRGYWCLPEVDLKMPLPDNMIALLQARYTKAVVHEAAVSGGRFNAAQCLERRLVDRAVPEDQVLPAAIEYAASQANKDRSTLAGIKQALYKDVMPRLVRAK